MCGTLSTPDLIGIFTGVVTALAAGATFLTVKEMKKQRESSYLPDLCIDTFSVRVYGDVSTAMLLSSKFKRINNFDREFQKSDEETSKFIKVRIHNIGLGAAKRIKFKWIFDYTTANKIVKNLPYYDNGLPEYILKYGLDELKEYTLSVVPPLDDLNISIPLVIWSHYFYYLALGIAADDKSNPSYFSDDFLALPQPTLLVSYTDIQNKVYIKEFLFSLSASHVVYNEQPDYFAVCMVKVQEIDR